MMIQAIRPFTTPVCPDNPWQWYRQYAIPFHPQYAYGYPAMGYLYAGDSRMLSGQGMAIRDHGKEPYVVNIAHVTKQNNNYRTALWTGEHFQVTVIAYRSEAISD